MHFSAGDAVVFSDVWDPVGADDETDTCELEVLLVGSCLVPSLSGDLVCECFLALEKGAGFLIHEVSRFVLGTGFSISAGEEDGVTFAGMRFGEGSSGLLYG